MEIPINLRARAVLAESVKHGIGKLVYAVTETETQQRSVFFVADDFDRNIAPNAEHFLQSMDRTYVVPPISIFALASSILIGSDGIVVFEGEAVGDTVRHIPIWLSESVVADYKRETSLTLRSRMAVQGHITGPTFIGFNAAWRNYAHWMQQCLPRIVVWQRMRGQLGFPKLIMPAFRAGSFQAETLRLLSIAGSNCIFVRQGEVLALGETFLMNEVGLFKVPSLCVDAGRQLVQATLGELRTRTVGERIYIHRTVQMRRPANFEAVRSVLDQNGFAILAFEDLPLAAQIDAMREARYIIGEHGAGLINLLFCKAGARVLELFNPVCIQPEFWSIASACGLGYGYLVGDHVPTLKRPDPDWNSAYVISADRLDAAIVAMLDKLENREIVPRG